MISLSALYFAQHGECFYCGEWAWIAGGQSHAAIKDRMGMPADTPRKALIMRQATREHLKRKADGGKDHTENLIMACYGCTSGRHDTPVLIHLANMRNAAALRRRRGSV